MVSNEVFLKKKKFRLTKSIKLTYFKGENNVRRSLNIKFWNCTDLLFKFLGKPRNAANFLLTYFLQKKELPDIMSIESEVKVAVTKKVRMFTKF